MKFKKIRLLVPVFIASAIVSGAVLYKTFRHKEPEKNIWQIRYMEIEERLAQCSAYAPECNPSIYYQVPECVDVQDAVADTIADQKNKCDQEKNKIRSQIQWQIRDGIAVQSALLIERRVTECERKCVEDDSMPAFECFYSCFRPKS